MVSLLLFFYCFIVGMCKKTDKLIKKTEQWKKMIKSIKVF
jgi:hypothetical protein